MSVGERKPVGLCSRLFTTDMSSDLIQPLGYGETDRIKSLLSFDNRPSLLHRPTSRRGNRKLIRFVNKHTGNQEVC